MDDGGGGEAGDGAKARTGDLVRGGQGGGETQSLIIRSEGSTTVAEEEPLGLKRGEEFGAATVAARDLVYECDVEKGDGCGTNEGRRKRPSSVMPATA